VLNHPSKKIFFWYMLLYCSFFFTLMTH
jgi:hypothetical protein